MAHCKVKDLPPIFNAISNTDLTKYTGFIKKHLNHKTFDVHKTAVYTLSKLNDKTSARHFVDLLFHIDEEVSNEAQKVFYILSGKFRKLIRGLMHTRASAYIHEIMAETNHFALEELNKISLAHLRRAYSIAGELTEVAKIDSLMKSKSRQTEH